jgi:signal transduction histidine kinase/CheY-like chemotaxis protein
MGKKTDKLRERALRILQKNSEEIPSQAYNDLDTLSEELRVHQIELETQNEELQNTYKDLEGANRRYINLYQNAPAPYITLSSSYKILKTNTEAASLMATTATALEGGKLTAFLHPRSRDILYHHIRATLHSNIPQECEVQLNTENEPHILMKSIKNSDTEILSLLIDITARITAEKKVSLLFEESTDAIGVVERSTGIIHACNPEWEKIAPHSGENKASVFDIFSAPEEMRTHLLTTEQTREFRNISVQGYLPHHYRVSLIPIDSRMAYVIATDISREHIEEQQKKMDSLSRMAGGIAHDFNNTLCSVRSALELLEDADTNHEFVDIIHIIEQGVSKSIEMTNQLLDISKNRNVEMEEVDIHTVIEQTLEFNRMSAVTTPATRFLPEAESSLIQGNTTDLHNLFSNILINARAAIEGNGQIYISTRNIELDENFSDVTGYRVAPGRYIEISIRDTGKGMKPEIQKRIFEPFYSTRRNAGGSGLGLARVYGIIQIHRGAVNVKSLPGRGTVFHIYLPLESPDKNKKKQPNHAAVPSPGHTPGRTILVVDDESTIRLALSHMLEKTGHHILTAETGTTAIEIFQREAAEIDLVILDMIMPGMNGDECFYKLREIQSNIPILLHTGFYDSEIMERLLQQNHTDFLKKPATQKILTEKINSIISQKR